MRSRGTASSSAVPAGDGPASSGQAAQPLEQVLGYLNFSSGAADLPFLANVNALFEQAGREKSGLPAWQEVSRRLTERLGKLRESSAAFRDADQAAAVLQLVFDQTLPAYRQFHGDLLFHHSDESLFRPYFVGRVCEAVLRQGPPWSENDRIVSGAIRLLNDFIGHRPIPALEAQQVAAYPHEFVRPIPLYIRGVGPCCGPEREVVALALKLVQETEDDLLRQACFDPDLLDELAIDPRAYDFDHPANKRPNYHFGQWDPHHIDNKGRYRRFVVQQVTLTALMRRLGDTADIPAGELLFEAAAVLAGTILMASGISGEGPGTFDSTITLSKLLPKIARYRDEFYERLVQRISGAHAERIKREAAEKRQPFGGARQHLNAQLARERASQLEHVHLARLFARMGHTAAAEREANIVPCASARMLCQIDCLMTTSQLACQTNHLEQAAACLPQIVDLLKRGVQCGAIVDPWNILGFDAHYSLFPALENSVRDHRADELVELMDRLWALYSRVWSEAAALDNAEVAKKVARQFKETAAWWHKFAVHEVSTVEAVDALVVYRAAEGVAQAIGVWHKGGAAAGDVAFWAPHAEMFDSPKAYALVIEALLERGDYVAAMALLVHWLGQAERIGLERADASFHDLVLRWFGDMTAPREPGVGGRKSGVSGQASALQRWDRARKSLDFIEANAEQLWNVPSFQLGSGNGSSQPRAGGDAPNDDEDEDGASRFDSAYEGMVFRDSTDDGVEGSIFETDESSHDELVGESKRVADRLEFLTTIASLWQMTSVSPALLSAECAGAAQGPSAAAIRRWIEQAEANRAGLARLTAEVQDFRIPSPSADHDSMVEYDRRRMTKESLLERIVTTSVETANANRLLWAALAVIEPTADLEFQLEPVRPEGGFPAPYTDEEQRKLIPLFAALLKGDAGAAKALALEARKELSRHPLLYVPLAKGGDPQQIVAVRVRQHAIQNLLAWLPRLGLWTETCELLEVARTMERDHPVGPGAVTEYDELFKIGYRAIVESLVASSQTWETSEGGEDRPEALVSCLEKLTEALLASWLAHSRTLRLSVLERVHDRATWKKMVAFIERYGSELFTQRFLNLGNIRAILHQGAAQWLTSLQEDLASRDFEGEVPQRLLDDLAAGSPLDDAAEQLSLVLESVVENYGEYRDYNSTTTQSDRGELLYMLLDFLRLRSRYDRVCWNLKPVVLAHEILVRRGEDQAARTWRKALTERIHEEANQYMAKLADLQKKYAMRMPTVADRLAERFVRPLAIDRIRALVAPAIAEARAANTSGCSASNVRRGSPDPAETAPARRGSHDPSETQECAGSGDPRTTGSRRVGPASEASAGPPLAGDKSSGAKPAPGKPACPKFEILQHDTEYLTREPTGVGLDVPAWLVALEEEVEDALRESPLGRADHDLAAIVQERLLSYDQARQQLDQWATRQQ